jgi:hypothetical protein
MISPLSNALCVCLKSKVIVKDLLIGVHPKAKWIHAKRSPFQDSDDKVI